MSKVNLPIPFDDLTLLVIDPQWGDIMRAKDAETLLYIFGGRHTAQLIWV